MFYNLHRFPNVNGLCSWEGLRQADLQWPKRCTASEDALENRTEMPRCLPLSLNGKSTELSGSLAQRLHTLVGPPTLSQL